MSPRPISAEAFEEMVLENMEDFDMSRTDAILDTKVQCDAMSLQYSQLCFLSNGKIENPISLDSLLCKWKLSGGSCTLYMELKTWMQDNTQAFVQESSWFPLIWNDIQNGNDNQNGEKEENDIQNAWTFLAWYCTLDGLNIFTENEFLQVLSSLSFLNACMKPYGYTVLRNMCLGREKVKVWWRKNQGKKIFMHAFTTILDNGEECKALSGVWRTLTVNDDVSANMSQVHDVVRDLMNDGIVTSILNMLMNFEDMPSVLAPWVLVLKQLAITEDHCAELVKLNVVLKVQTWMQRHADHTSLLRTGISMMRNIVAADQFKSYFVHTSGMEGVLQAMDRHDADAKIQEVGCATLATAALRHPALCTHMVSVGAHRAIAKALKQHASSPANVRQASLALRNMVVRNPELRETILQEQVETVLRASQCIRDCGDEAYAALRDLGCKIQLQGAPAKAHFNPTTLQSQELHSNIDAEARAPFSEEIY